MRIRWFKAIAITARVAEIIQPAPAHKAIVTAALMVPPQTRHPKESDSALATSFGHLRINLAVAAAWGKTLFRAGLRTCWSSTASTIGSVHPAIPRPPLGILGPCARGVLFRCAHGGVGHAGTYRRDVPFEIRPQRRVVAASALCACSAAPRTAERSLSFCSPAAIFAHGPPAPATAAYRALSAPGRARADSRCASYQALRYARRFSSCSGVKGFLPIGRVTRPAAGWQALADRLR
jgi:hypothetical protein